MSARNARMHTRLWRSIPTERADSSVFSTAMDEIGEEGCEK